MNIQNSFKKNIQPLKAGLHCFLDFIYPSDCVVCQSVLGTHDDFCPDCRSALADAALPHVYQHPSDFSQIHSKLYLDRVISCWSYSEAVEAFIHRMKYQFGKKLCQAMGQWMGEILQAHAFDFDGLVVPVPLHPIRRRERGYNQSQLLCHGFTSVYPLAADTEVLRRVKYTQTQTQLSAEQRQENVHDAFSLKNSTRIRNSTVYLLDDVVTTGATMNSCARILKEYGVSEVVGLSLVRPD